MHAPQLGRVVGGLGVDRLDDLREALGVLEVDGAQQLLAAREVAVDRRAVDAGADRDRLHVGARVLREHCARGVDHRRDAAARVGAQRARPLLELGHGDNLARSRPAGTRVVH